MIIYFSIAVMTIMLSYYVKKNTLNQNQIVSRQMLSNRVAIGAIFMLLFALSATRWYVGNDYGPYLAIFQNLHDGVHVSTEFGFNLVVRIAQALFGTGVWTDRFLFALFSFGTIFFFLKAIYDQSEDFLYSMFLFMASGYFFSSMTSVRYYFVLAIALYAMKYALSKRWIPFILWICFAACFHKTVLLVIPVYWLAMRKWKNWQIIAGICLCSTFLLFQNVYRRLIFMIYPYYENSAFDKGETSIVNILKGLCILILCLLFYQYAIKGKDNQKFYFMLNLGALALYIFCPFIPEISRIAFYLNIASIFLVPGVLKDIPNKRWRWFFYVAVTVAFTVYFILYIRTFTDISIRLLPYQSFIFS